MLGCYRVRVWTCWAVTGLGFGHVGLLQGKGLDMLGCYRVRVWTCWAVTGWAVRVRG